MQAGHEYHNIIEVYPFELVILLLKIARENQRAEMLSQAHIHSVAVMNALDVGFNKGKGKILDTWSRFVAGDLIEQNKPVQKIVSERTLSFFDSLPKTTKKRKNK